MPTPMKEVGELRTQFPIRMRINTVERIRNMTPSGLSVNAFICKMLEERLAEYEKAFGPDTIKQGD